MCFWVSSAVLLKQGNTLVPRRVLPGRNKDESITCSGRLGFLQCELLNLPATWWAKFHEAREG
jgi:hypothetical protein